MADIVPVANAPPTTALMSKRELAASKLCPNIKTAEQAGFLFSWARALRVDPAILAPNVHFISGKPTLSANMQAVLLKRSERYRYKVLRKNAKECVIEFWEKLDKWEAIGTETFTMDDAIRASLTGNPSWKKFPSSMLFARCLTSGIRTYAPDVLGGVTSYTPDELDTRIEVNEQGSVIDGVVEAVVYPDELAALIAETATDTEALLAHYGVASISKLSSEQAEHALRVLKAKKESRDNGTEES